MNQRKAGTILSYVHIIITNTISLIYTPFMLRMLGQSEYGLYGTANSFISYLTVLNFGIGGAYIRFNAKCRVRQDKEEEKRLNGMFLTIFAVLSLLVFVGGMSFIFLAEKLVKNTFTSQELLKLRVIMFIMTINIMVSFIFNVVMMALQAYEEFVFIRLVLLCAGIINPIVNVTALMFGGRAVTISAISCIISILSYLTFFVYARRKINMQFSFSGFKKSEMKELFIFSGFLFLNSVTDQITFSTDNLILSAMKGTSAVAIYSVGSNFKIYFQNFSSSISSVFAPQINRIVANNGSTEDLDEIFTRVGRIQFYIVSLILIGYLSIGYDFVKLWAGQDYGDAFYVGFFLMLAVFVPAFQNVGLEIQKAKNMHKARSIAYFLIALVNVLLTIPFCVLWGGVGAALATAICMFMGTVVFMNIYYAKKIRLDIKSFWKSIFSILPGYILPVAVSIVINRLWKLDSYYDIFGAAVVIAISFIGSVWLFSMNEYEKYLIKKPIVKLISLVRNK